MKRVILLALGMMIVLTLTTKLPQNAWGLLEGHGSYFIPEESSIWTFQVDADTAGSGSFWLRGSDRTRYYALSETTWEYFHIEKENDCERFDPVDISTWCELRATPIPLPH
ncbi:hypothetical protein [Pleomorphomonas sp. JP5]|uniref:hypothetical protein n=1 Tax=Pleomorphomonas sp. JP5 TaxID=2942998 RepID=UPI00204327AD|nr:hypothetical protein [Pleomorphomonas sp. JP5]MCM5557516.1 hypothetical protein [Pleomorphomonas sp. JP5]